MSQGATALAQRLAELEERLRNVERGSRLSNASMHGAPLLVYSPDDPETVRQIIGTQADGTITTVDVNAPAPPMPSVPTVEAHPGVLVITWDGTFSGGAIAPADLDHIEVHVSTLTGYETSDATEVITIHSLKGGSVTLALDAVPQYVRLQAVNTSRVESAATPEVAATPTAPVLTGGIKTYYEAEAPIGLDADDNGSLWFDTDNGNLMYRWDGVGLEWVAVPIGPAAITTDGNAPTTAPSNVEVIGGFGALFVRFLGIVNPDPVEYEVHVAKNANFTPDYAGGGTGPEFFETFTSDLSRWGDSYGGPVVTGGKARLTSSPGATMGITSTQRFTMTAKSVSAKIEPQAVPGATQQVIFEMLGDAQNSFQMIKLATNTAIICRVRVNGVSSDLSVPVSAAAVWWRMREAAGSINFEVSSDNAAWTVLRTVAHGMSAAAIGDMQIDISCGDTNPGSVLTPLVTLVDDVAYGSEVKSKTLATVTAGSSFTIRTLPNGQPLVYDGQPYYVKVVAKDADGYGPFSGEASGMVIQITTPDISANYAYLGTLLVDQLRGGTLAADVILGAVMRTAEVGQRAEMGPFGFVTYDSLGQPVIVMPSNGDQTANIRAQVEALGLTVTGKAAFRASVELSSGSGLTLQASVTGPQSPPSAVVDWPSTVIPLFAAGTGENPANNHGLNWIDGGWQIMTSQTNGYLIRKFNADGTLASVLDNWASAAGIENQNYSSGVNIAGTSYTMQRDWGTGQVNIQKWTTGGSGSPTKVAYNRVNTSQMPHLGWDGTSLMIVEHDATNKRFRIQFVNPATLAISSTIFTSAQNGFNGPVSGIVRGSMDLGAPRFFITTETSLLAWSFDGTGTYIGNESYAVKGTGARGIGWDGTRFWTLATGGTLTKHAPAVWNDGFEQQTWYAAQNWRDTDAGGTGVHETDMGPVAVFQMRRRAWLTLTSVAIPDNGGTDDADAVGFFVGRVNTSRVNLWRQTDPATGVRSATYETFTFASSNPPAANNFPAATPAWIRSAGLDAFGLPALEFKGDGTGRFGGMTIEQFLYSNRARSQLNGGGLRKVDATGISWDARLMTTATGFSTDTAQVGYFDISRPADGTVIPGVGGAANQTVAAGIVPLPAWHALYYILPIGSGMATLAANFRIATYTAALNVPPHWVLVCFRSGEPRSAAYVWGDGKETDTWRNVTMTSPWVIYNASYQPSYRKENGIVYMRGLLKSASAPAAPSDAASIPAGYRPGQIWTFASKAAGANGNTINVSTTIASRINVYPDGTIEIYDNPVNAASFVSLFGITYPAEN
jgi:hypothetical protein